MHIVYISREFPPALRMGGIASYVREIAETMVRRGHEVTVISASDDTSKEYSECINGVNVIRLSGGDFVLPQKESTAHGLKKLRTIYRFNSYRKNILRALNELHEVDIIEVAEYGAEGSLLTDIELPVTLRLHTPTLLDRATGGTKKWNPGEFHEYWVGRKEFADMQRYRYATSCSISLAEWAKNNVPGFSAEVDVIYNPLNMSNWVWNDNQDYQENTILFAGTVSQPKGIGELVAAVAALQSGSQKVRLKVAGKLGDYGKRLQEECKAKGYDWCEFVGHVSREELKSLYREAKVSCFPSWWENMPMVCIEAMATGNVVIGSCIGGMAEIITPGEDGFLVEPRNVDAMVSVLHRALALNRLEVNRLRNNAYSKVLRQFSGDTIAAQLEKHYRKVINEYGKNIVDKSIVS